MTQQDSSADHRVAKPLVGVRVVDFSRLLPGAYCTWMLATLGADVVKVEQPGKGDYQRDIGQQVGDRGSALFQLVNQGKRSVGLDLQMAGSQPVLQSLLDSADVVVESFRPGVAARLGIDFDALRVARPAVVCLSISGFGSNSPMARTAAHDINYMAHSGLLGRQLREGEGMPDLPFVDLIGGGLVPALSALALLFRARTTGVGGIADAALADALPLLPYDILTAALQGLPEPRKWDADFSGAAANYTVYALSDGFVAVGAVEEPFWRELCRRMELSFVPAIRGNPQFQAMKDALSRKFLAMSRQDAEGLFRGADACVTVVQSYGEVLASEHAKVREYVKAPVRPGTMPRLGSPFFHDGRREFATGLAPLLGEHTIQVLQELGYPRASIDALLADGVAAAARSTTIQGEDGR